MESFSNDIQSEVAPADMDIAGYADLNAQLVASFIARDPLPGAGIQLDLMRNEAMANYWGSICHVENGMDPGNRRMLDQLYVKLGMNPDDAELTSGEDSKNGFLTVESARYLAINDQFFVAETSVYVEPLLDNENVSPAFTTDVWLFRRDESAAYA